MPWKQVSESPRRSPRFEHAVIPNLRIQSLVRDRSYSGFTIPLNGGTARINSGSRRSSSRFLIEVKLPESGIKLLVRELTYNGTEPFEHSFDKNRNSRGLYLGATLSIGSEQKVYQLPIMPAGYDDLKMNPTMPRELTQKGNRGVSVRLSGVGSNVDTLEGIDAELNGTALSFARQLHKVFGLEYGKIDAECVKSVCVYPKSISLDELLELLKNRDISIGFWRNKVSYAHGREGVLTVSYSDSTLIIKGIDQGAYDSFRLAYQAENLVRDLGITTDETRPMTYSKYYSTSLQKYLAEGVGNAANAIMGAFRVVVDKLPTPLASYRERQYERGLKMRAGLERLLEDRAQSDRDVSGGICIVQYDPACVLRKAAEPEGKPS